MRTLIRFVPVVGCVTAIALIGATAPASGHDASGHGRPDSGPSLSIATLPDIGLAVFQNKVLPNSIADDRGVDLGGIGSDLYPAGHDEFWTVTDRGPNGQIEVDGKNRRTFPVPSFDPAIVKIKVKHGTVKVLETVPLRTRSGAPVTGLSNQPGHDEAPYNFNASTELSYNANGLDTEGLVVARDGSFWLCEEYSPSILHVGRDGRVIARYVPQGLGLTGTGYPVVETLPAILALRKQNRGFEGLAISPDGKTLYAAVQSPLSNPTKKIGEASRNIRFLAVSTRTGRPVAEYAYRMEAIDDFDPGAGGKQDDMKISGLVALGKDRLLVDERTDARAQLYVADLRRATDILGSSWDDTATTPSLEAAADLPVRGAAKSLLLDLGTVPGLPGKIEGIAVTGHRTIVVASDNDFGMTDGPGAFDADGRLVDSGKETIVATLTLPRGHRVG